MWCMKSKSHEPWEPLKDQVYVDVCGDAGTPDCALGRCHRTESMSMECTSSWMFTRSCRSECMLWELRLELESWQPEILSFWDPFHLLSISFQYSSISSHIFHLFPVTVLFTSFTFSHVFSLALHTEVLRLLAWIIGGSASTAQDFLVRGTVSCQLLSAGKNMRRKERSGKDMFVTVLIVDTKIIK